MIKIKITDGELSINGEFNFGYMGIYKDEQISIYDDVSEIREWEIVESHFDFDFTDDELAEFLTEYFNNFGAKIQANIKQVNNNFLIDAYEWAEGTGLEFWEVPKITNKNTFLKILKVLTHMNRSALRHGKLKKNMNILPMTEVYKKPMLKLF